MVASRNFLLQISHIILWNVHRKDFFLNGIGFCTDGRRGPRKRGVLRMLLEDYLRCSGGLWLLMVTTKELGTYQPVDVLSTGDDVLGALVVTG
jgi:hypothetical protein